MTDWRPAGHRLTETLNRTYLNGGQPSEVHCECGNVSQARTLLDALDVWASHVVGHAVALAHDHAPPDLVTCHDDDLIAEAGRRLSALRSGLSVARRGLAEAARDR